MLEGTGHSLIAIYKRWLKLEKCFHGARLEEGPPERKSLQIDVGTM